MENFPDIPEKQLRSLMDRPTLEKRVKSSDSSFIKCLSHRTPLGCIVKLGIWYLERHDLASVHEWVISILPKVEKVCAAIGLVFINQNNYSDSVTVASIESFLIYSIWRQSEAKERRFGYGSTVRPIADKQTNACC